MRIVAPLLKVGCASGVVYLAAESGVFSHSQKETIEAGKKMKTSVPAIDSSEVVPKGITQYFQADMDFAGYWNKGVKATTNALASFPSEAAGLMACGIHHLKKEVQKQLNTPSNTQNK